MSARDAILGRIRVALANELHTGAPPSYELWPAGTWQQPDDLFARFVDELQRVQGEARRFGTMDEARQFFRDLLRELGMPRTVLVDHLACRALGAGPPVECVAVLDPAMDRKQLAPVRLAVLSAEFLIADTGTALLLPRSHAERLLCYLPEITVLVAERDRVVAHLSDIWDCMSGRAADSARRGEMLLVTGPSRTADIEKKLVLGAHGPKRLIVLLVNEAV